MRLNTTTLKNGNPDVGCHFFLQVTFSILSVTTFIVLPMVSLCLLSTTIRTL